MKHYTIDNKTTDYLPDPCKGVSPMTDERFVQLGGTITDDGKPSPFEAACAQFRTLCAAIGAFIGDSTFDGGFEDYAEFANSDAYKSNPVQGNAYAIQWSALNELCKYEGSKIGLGQPAWFYKCWEMAD